ncbi:MAG: amidase [Aggregatilineales bacterium]
MTTPQPPEASPAPDDAALIADMAAAERLIGLEFTDSEHALMLDGVRDLRANYDKLRTVHLDNGVPPAIGFSPLVPGLDIPPSSPHSIAMTPAELPPIPADLEDMAFWPVTWLARAIESRQVTSQALTDMYLARLKRYDPILHCVVTLTEDLAREQAKQADAEIAAGHYRGPLHGIPWGVKDLLAVRGYPTTWGSPIFKEQVIDFNASVVERLTEAGAVLLAKLSVGELAMDDEWFGGMTRTPWDVSQGSSGSSAGSGSAVAAGLVGFAIGTETYGSIVSPSTQCRVTGLRPTFGRVSKHGAMQLSWTMDKIGPMARSVEDCALVFNAIYGPDGQDSTVTDAPFHWPPDKSARDLRIGYVPALFEEENDHTARNQAALDVLRGFGYELIPIQLPDYPINAMEIILHAEAAALFDDLTRTNEDDRMVRQRKDAWPNFFRVARLIPAVEYVQAQRVRTLAMHAMVESLANVDVLVTPSFGGNVLLLTNLTGHPTVVVPNGAVPDKDGKGEKPSSISFVGHVYGETETLAAAQAYQDATDFHVRRPTFANSAAQA